VDYEPSQTDGLRQRSLRPGGYNRRIQTDMGTGEVVVTATKDIGHWIATDTGLTCEGITVERYSLRPPDPLSTQVEVTSRNAMERPGWRVETRARTLVGCTADAFELKLDLEAHEGERRLYERSWNVTVPRHGV
jgi:hypothetical protein